MVIKVKGKGIFGPHGGPLTLGATDSIKITGIYTQKKFSRKEILDKGKILEWWENLKHR